MARIRHRSITVGATSIFYRETVPLRANAGQHPILLLHGFPSSSHQFRGMMQALGHEFRMIAPDCPGFGQTQIKAGEESRFEYSFENLSCVIEEFIDTLDLGPFLLYAFDFGGPVGFRIAVRRPELIAGLIIQNANAYDAGLSEGARHFANIDGHDVAGVRALERLMSLDGIKFQYLTGVSDPETIAPDSYMLDQHYLEPVERKAAMMALLLDYKTNLAEYPAWQDWLRRHLPPAQILWGRNDPLFTEAGARAYLADLPHAEFQLFDTGHFALEECLGEIAPLVAGFARRIGQSSRASAVEQA